MNNEVNDVTDKEQNHTLGTSETKLKVDWESINASNSSDITQEKLSVDYGNETMQNTILTTESYFNTDETSTNSPAVIQDEPQVTEGSQESQALSPSVSQSGRTLQNAIFTEDVTKPKQDQSRLHNLRELLQTVLSGLESSVESDKTDAKVPSVSRKEESSEETQYKFMGNPEDENIAAPEQILDALRIDNLRQDTSFLGEHVKDEKIAQKLPAISNITKQDAIGPKNDNMSHNSPSKNRTQITINGGQKKLKELKRTQRAVNPTSFREGHYSDVRNATNKSITLLPAGETRNATVIQTTRVTGFQNVTNGDTSLQLENMVDTSNSQKYGDKKQLGEVQILESGQSGRFAENLQTPVKLEAAYDHRMEVKDKVSNDTSEVTTQHFLVNSTEVKHSQSQFHNKSEDFADLEKANLASPEQLLNTLESPNPNTIHQEPPIFRHFNGSHRKDGRKIHKAQHKASLTQV